MEELQRGEGGNDVTSHENGGIAALRIAGSS